jgi:hypothetical protein
MTKYHSFIHLKNIYYDGDVAQVTEHLFSKRETLSSNFRTTAQEIANLETEI